MSEHDIDPALLRGLTTRRGVFRLAGLAGAGFALAACGVEGKKAAKPKKDDVQKFWSGKKENGSLVFANWPYYMDPKRPELKQFSKETGTKVAYKEVIQDNASFYAKVRPQLAADQSIGYDIIVMTNGTQFSQMVDLGFLAPLDHDRLPNFAKHAGEKYKEQSFDPGNVYSVPWASGFTGLIYNAKYIDEEITSIQELWNPKYKGKVGMLSDTQEIGAYGMIATGADPEKSTKADWEKAAAKLKEQRDKGIVRKYYDQAYIDAVGKGDVWLTMGWSGDVFQRNLEGGDLRFVIPEEGGIIWTDNMVIPTTAKNPVDAITLMDYFYQPEIAGSLAEYINYITPVPKAQGVIEKDAAEAKGEDKEVLEMVAESPLVFPTAEDYANTSSYRVFKNSAEKKEYESIFQPIVTS
ncbi:MAG: extracellular solute-binding protein [Streptosporangiales bacterium]|nr:extracellular solute-binding protein [Streptosporangiales bacterium]